MSKKLNFNEVKEINLKILEQYVPIVARVHGESHPEFHEVHKVFDKINIKIKEVAMDKPDLEEELNSYVKLQTTMQYLLMYAKVMKLFTDFYLN